MATHHDVYAAVDRRLHAAVRCGSIAAIKEALRDGWPPNGLGFNSETALHWASALNSPEAIRLLMAAPGCDPGIEDADGRTPLKIAQDRGHAEAIALLSRADDAGCGITKMLHSLAGEIERLRLAQEKIDARLCRIIGEPAEANA